MLRKCRRLPPAGLLRGSAAPRGRGACGKSTDSDSVPDEQRLKPMEELHGPSLLTNLNWLFLKRYFTIPHELQIEHSKIYGPLWKSKYGPLVVVNVARVDLIEQVLKQEGKYPIRTDMPHWRRYRELRNKAHGPLTEMGENWQRMRSILNPRLLKLDHMTSYGNTINEVVTDFIQRLAWLRDTNGQGVMVHNVTGELYKFAFEGICSVLFEARMGSLDAVMPEETQKFIFSVGEMFHLSQVVIFFPQSWWPWMSSWKRFEAAWDQIFKVGEDLVKKKMDALEKRADVNLDTEGAYLTHLLLSGKMTVPEILGSISELLLAGVDTTSNTVSWALYLLAKHPEIQQQLYQEVIDVCPGDKIPDSSDVSQMQFLKAVIKETLRMYPVVPGNARLIKEHEAVVGGYLFPKDTLFHLCHYATSYDEELFPNPRTFLPRRWLRVDGEMPKRNPFGSLPFGFSVRACLGRRIAELEMNLLLSRLIKQFEVRPDPAGVVVKPITRTLLCPGSAIDLQFVDRPAQ